jgi:hypothetical protein
MIITTLLLPLGHIPFTKTLARRKTGSLLELPFSSSYSLRLENIRYFSFVKLVYLDIF